MRFPFDGKRMGQNRTGNNINETGLGLKKLLIPLMNRKWESMIPLGP
jgi:hypothetical protein